MMPEGYIQPASSSESLVGIDGNAYAVMGFVRRELRRAGNPPDILAAYTAEATSGDYNNVLATSMRWLDGEEGS